MRSPIRICLSSPDVKENRSVPDARLHRFYSTVEAARRWAVRVSLFVFAATEAIFYVKQYNYTKGLAVCQEVS